MTNHKKSFGAFLDEFHATESIPQKVAKIDERLTQLDEENREDYDMQKIIKARTTSRNSG